MSAIMKLWPTKATLASRPDESFPYSRADFDARAYLSMNEDIKNAGLDPWKHFVEFGYSEGRRFTSIDETIASYIKIAESGNFDPNWYVREYPDIGKDGSLALKHFCDFGVWEGRDPGPNFSTSWYLEQYPDIRGMNPLLHYIEHGIREGRSANAPRGALKTLERQYAGIRDLDVIIKDVVLEFADRRLSAES